MSFPYGWLCNPFHVVYTVGGVPHDIKMYKRVYVDIILWYTCMSFSLMYDKKREMSTV